MPLNTKSTNTEIQISYNGIVTNHNLRRKNLKTESIIQFADA